MPAPTMKLEGTWEEIVARAPELAGRRVRLTVLAAEDALTFREASGSSLLRHAGSWAGDDLAECREIVYATRGPSEFECVPFGYRSFFQ